MTLRRIDVDPETLRALEFGELLEWLATHARTTLGGERIRGLQPSADGPRVRREIASTSEASRYLDAHGAAIPSMLPDPSPARGRLQTAGDVPDARMLRDLAAVLAVASDLGGRLRIRCREGYPNLLAYAADLPDLARETSAVLDGTDPEGRILDGASPELQRIRRAAQRAAERLQRMLRRFLRDPDSEPLVRDEFITQRNGRYVVPVRTDAPRSVQGIVHAVSSSGATRFVEPLESVELNNEIVRLAEAEQAEQHRIVAAWTRALRARREEVDAALGVLGRIDELQARALFGRECGGVAAAVEDQGAIELDEVRHPLLERRLREEGQAAVPLAIRLDPADQVLLLSGPNTGGKTVALKTLGLAVLMAQAGIPVPARRLRLPVFRQVRADIGDHQSIEADLSTFSAHVRALVGFLDGLERPALLLFDEMGTGTEPSEGAALARAVLETLRTPGTTTVATTHMGALKAWAFTTEGASCAAMEFDSETLAPTYRIQMGVAGVSAGLDIAERLGLDPEIVARARAGLAPDAREGEGYLKKLRELASEMEDARERQTLREARLEERDRELTRRIERESRAHAERAGEALDAELAAFRLAVRSELAKARDDAERARVERGLQRGARRVEAEHRNRRAALAPAGDRPESAGWVEPETLEPGMRVFVRSLGREGRVTGLRGEAVDVELGEMVLRAARSDLRVPPAGDGRSEPTEPDPRPASVPVAVNASAARELMLVGERVDAAMARLDRFLDAAVVAGLDEVRVVHGHGTGRLRAAVREFLEGHPQVAGQRPGGRHEGGEGATIARLV